MEAAHTGVQRRKAGTEGVAAPDGAARRTRRSGLSKPARAP